MNIAINGFGRIGRLGFRAGWNHPEYNITAINEIDGTAETGAHLLEFDTVHGRWDRQISHDSSSITVENKTIAYTHARTPSEMNLDGVDIVIDSTGAYRTPELLQPYFDAGVKKVIVAATLF